jgi:hypothetical protein
MNKFIVRLICSGLFWVTLVLPFQATMAHHSAVAFDQTSTTEVSGTVTQFIWRSPHLSINMNVINDKGETELWKIEGGSTAAMARQGFDKQSLTEGDLITVRINPMRSGNPGGLLQGLILADGTPLGMDIPEVEQAAERKIPSLTAYIPPPPGETLEKRELRHRPDYLPIINTGAGAGASNVVEAQAGVLDPENLAKTKPGAFELTGTWRYRGEESDRATYGSYEFKPHPTFTAKGQANYDEYQQFAAEGKRWHEPTALCHPAGLPRMMTRYGSLMMLQYSTAIFMVSRLNNEYRVIYLDGRKRVPANIRDANYGGESLGHWEGDTLVVETEGFTDENHLIQVGVLTGDQLKITERIKMLNDNNTMMIEYTMVDPEYWVGEWKHIKFRDRVLRSDVKEANCLFEDNLALPGILD